MLGLLAIALLLGLCIYLRRALVRSRAEVRRLAAEVESLQQERQLVVDFLHDIGEAFEQGVDRERILGAILASTVKVTHAKSGAIFLRSPDGTSLLAEDVFGLFPPSQSLPKEVVAKVATRTDHLRQVLRHQPIPLQPGNPVGDVCLSGEPLVANEPRADPRFPVLDDDTLRLDCFLAVPMIYRGECLGVIALANRTAPGGFSEVDVNLARSIADQAGFSLYNANAFAQLAQKQQLDRDLDTAREIQTILLPRGVPVIPGYALAAANVPATQVSGDYYDFIRIDENRWGLAIADVSGKGVPASLIMAMGRTLLRTQAAGLSSPAEVLRRVNRLLHPDIRPDMFITMAYLVLDTVTGEITSAKAGHDAPLLYRARTGQIEPLQSPGLALGIDSGEVFDTVLDDCTIRLEPGDLLVAYTDGVSEAFNQTGEEFGREQIQATLLHQASGSPEDVVENLLQRVTRFQGDAVQNDDITLVALKRL